MFNPILDFVSVEREARTRAANKNIILTLEDQNKPRTNGKVIYVQKPRPEWNADKWVVWWFTFEHELGHNDPDMIDCFELIRSKKIDMKSFFGTVLNILDDIRQERYRNGEYAGRDRRLNEGRHRFLTTEMDWTKYGQVSGRGHDADMRMWAIETLAMWDCAIRQEFQPMLHGISESKAHVLNDTQVEWLDLLLGGNYGDIILSGINAEEEYDLTKRIINEVFKFDADEEEEQGKKQSKSSDEGNDEGGQEGDGGDSEQQSSDDSSEEEGKCDGTVKYSDVLAHQHDDDGGRGDGASYNTVKIDYDGYDDSRIGYPNTPLEDYRTTDYTRGLPATKHRTTGSGYARRIMSLDSNGLSSKVRRLLQSRAQTRYQHGLKRGKISPKSIHRVAVGGRHAERVFRKKTENDTLDTAVSILVDCSGSMGGGPYAHAAKASIMLHEALSPLNIPLEIIGFTDHHNGPHHAIFKSFRSRTTVEDMAKAYDHFAYDMDANSDGQSIVWTYDRLMKQRNTRKVLLVLSDGQPSGYNGDAWKHTQNVIKEIEGSKSVDICAIGIMDKTVERLYTNHSVISSASELESAVLNIISNRIINH